jgi:hypothetical protein
VANPTDQEEQAEPLVQPCDGPEQLHLMRSLFVPSQSLSFSGNQALSSSRFEEQTTDCFVEHLEPLQLSNLAVLDPGTLPCFLEVSLTREKAQSSRFSAEIPECPLGSDLLLRFSGS